MLHETLEKVRSTSPTAYQEMLKSMLSLVLSIPAGFNFDDLEVPSSARSDTIFGAPLTTEGICTITQLIEHIKKPKNIATEGIFRKSGVPSRGARLQALLCSGGTLSINLDLEQAQQQVSIHDVCCLLKRFIADLPSPLLLGDRLGELWRQVQPSLGPARRLEAVQLLLLLLPAAHRLFFADLVGLFAAVVAQSAANRMTASNLATIFTPILFLPRDVSPTVLAASSPTLTAALSFIIASGPVVMEPPASLLANAAEYLSKLKRRMQAAASTGGGPRSLMAAGGAASMMSTTALIPSTQFCTPVATPKDYTAMMLEQLAQEVQAMPSSAAAKNHGARRVLKSLKKNADSLKTPLPKLKRDKVQQEMIREQLKRSAKASSSASKSSSSSSSSASSVVSNFGSAIKRKLRIGGGGGGGSSHRSSNSSSTSSSFSASNVSCSNSTTSFEVGALPARVPMPTMAAASGGSRRKSVSATALPPPAQPRRQASPTKAKTPTMTPANGKRQSMAVGVTSPCPLKKVEEEEDDEKKVVLEQKPLPTPVKVPEPAAAAAASELKSSPPPSTPPAAQSPSPPLLPARSAAVKSSISSRSLLPPPLPPKPSPRTVSLKRKASVYSLPPLPHTVSAGSRTTSSSNGGGRSISADLQPTTTTTYLEEEEAEAAEDRFHLNKHHRPAQRQQQHISTPLKELSNRRKVSSQIEKFESLATAASMIPRLTRSATVSRKPSIPKCAEEDGENEAEAEDDQQYVVLSKITTTTTTSSKKVVEEKLKKVKKCTSAAGGVRRNSSSCSEAGKQQQQNQQNQQQQAKHRRVLRSNTNSPRSRVPVVVVHHPHPQQQQQHQRVSRTGSGSRRRLVPSTPL